MPSGAGSPQLLPAPPSTKPLPAASVQLTVHPPADSVSFFPAGGSGFLLGDGIAGNKFWDENSEGLSEGRDGVRAKLEGCALSADCDLGRGIL